MDRGRRNPRPVVGDRRLLVAGREKALGAASSKWACASTTRPPGVPEHRLRLRGNANPYIYPTDPITGFDLTGKSWWRSVGRGIESGARFLTNNRWASAALTARGFIPGLIGTGCGVLQGAAYAVQGRWRSAAGCWAGGAAAGGFRLAARAVIRAGVRDSVYTAGRYVSRRVVRRQYSVARWTSTAFGNLIGSGYGVSYNRRRW